jgi:hypothetical protein
MTKLAEYIGTFVEAVMVEDPKASVTVRAEDGGVRLDVRRYTETRKYGASQIASSYALEHGLYPIQARAKDHARVACADIARLMAKESK